MTATTRFPDSMTLADARVELRTLAADGHKCPLCRQWVQIRKRPLSNVHARTIAALYAAHYNRYGHLPTVIAHSLSDIAGQGGYLLLGKHWGLIEPEGDEHTPGRDGHWRVTQLGIDWLHGNTTVPKYAEIYNKRCWGLSGPLVSREDVLGEHFDFAALQAVHASVPDDLLEQASAA